MVVLAISYEAPGKIREFLEKSGYTIRAGSDPGKRVIGAYGVSGYPSSALIGKDGTLLWKGSPYGSEVEIEKALGLPLDAGGALDAFLSKPGQESIEHLLRKAASKFDAKAWAANTEVPALAEGKKPAKMKTAKALDALRKGKREAVHSLRAYGETDFDLAGWARAIYKKQFPLKKSEMQALLGKRHYRTAMDALLARKSTGSVLKAASKDDGFVAYCAAGWELEGKMARKGIMAKHWPFANRIPNDQRGFWSDMSVSGMAMSEDRKRLTGILMGGSMIMAESVDYFIATSQLRHLLMKAIAEGGTKSVAKLEKQAAKENKRILNELKGHYGWADPIVPK